MARRLNKPIVELDKPKGKIKYYWRSAKAAADFHKWTNQIGISYNVNGITQQAKGHYFRFATPAEIATYEEILRKQAAEQAVKPEPIVAEQNLTAPPADIIPEVVQKDDNQQDKLSPFEQMLQKSKKKFNDNSE